MPVCSPKGWLALATTGVLLGSALVWSLVGSIPERVPGQGILLQSGGVLEVVSQSGGRVTDMPIRVGDMITEGQVVARLAQPELAEQLRLQRGKVAELVQQTGELENLVARDAALRSAALARRHSDAEASIRALETMAANLQDRVANEERLVAQGLLTRQALIATRQEFERAKEQVRARRSEMAQMRVERLQSESQHQQQLWAMRSQLAEARRQLAQQEADMEQQSIVSTPYSGRVLEVMAEQGAMAERGAPILSVSLEGKSVKNLEAVLYVRSTHGKKILPGMTVEIVPSTVKREAFGYLIGRVTYVSDFPATPQGMLRVLKNSKLVEALSGADAPYEVHADLIPDASSPSQYVWSSSHGPPMRIQSGTLATAQTVVSYRRPILMVLPQLRGATGPDPSAVGGAGRRPAPGVSVRTGGP